MIQYIFIHKREGHWEQDPNAYVREWLVKHKIAKLSIHTSGHASLTHLKRFTVALAPPRIVPIHTFMPEKYSGLFNNIELHTDGEY